MHGYTWSDCVSYILPISQGNMHGAACVQLAHSSLGDWNDIFVAILSSSSNRKYPHSPLLGYFPVVVCLTWLYNLVVQSVIGCIYVPGVLHYWSAVYGVCKWSGTLWPVDLVRLFPPYIISLSALCKHIWRQWNSKIFVRYMLSNVCLRLSYLLCFYKWGCVFSLPNYLVMIVRVCTLSHYHHQIGSMNH